MKLVLNVHEYDDGWVSAAVEDWDGNRLGEDTAPVVEGATFDARTAVIRSAVEEALTTLKQPREQEQKASEVDR